VGQTVNGTTRFALFGEVLLVGAVVLVLSLPIVTAVPALAVGVRHLRRFLAGEADSAGRLLRDVLPALRDLWPLGLLAPAALLLLGYNLWFAGTGLSSGGQVVGVVSAAVGAALVVVVLRAAGTWVPGQQQWWRPLRAAARRARLDLGGSILLLAAVVMCGVLVWMLTPLLLIVGGLLVLAMLAVENRSDRALGKDAPSAE
jgi:hypothetical protein